MNTKSKVIAILIMVVTLFSIAGVLFESYAVLTPDNITPVSTSGEGELGNLGGQALSIITTVGSIAAIIILIVLGLKYMMGSTEEKAEYKKTLMPYVIGAIFVFAASTIAGVIYNIAKGI